MYKDIYVIFDFKNKEIMIEIKDKNKKTYKITKKMNVTRIDDYNVMETIELPISKVSESPQGIVSQESKWVFSWNCWNNKQQFLKLEQYVPFPVCDKIFHPEHYDPWYTLACWSYIPEPTYGTTQTNDIIYEKKTNFHNKYKLTMEIKGSKYDWIATNNYRHPDPLQI